MAETPKQSSPNNAAPDEAAPPAPVRGDDYLEGSDTRAGSDEGGSAPGEAHPATPPPD
ncbi:MAG: hypothetical protein JSR45_01145 [Proteobacteria bacterium]|nr:hypothetical protein [Pseudomonadota bacterium]